VSSHSAFYELILVKFFVGSLTFLQFFKFVLINEYRQRLRVPDSITILKQIEELQKSQGTDEELNQN